MSAEPAGAGVEVVPQFALERYEQRGAIGLLVPGAGPTVSRDSALAALLRGRVEHSALGRLPGGQPVITLGATGEPQIRLALPAPGESPNNRRYPIAIVGNGYGGILVSEATRIPGLVSIVDVAPTWLDRDDALSWREHEDAAKYLRELDELIREKNQARGPAMFLAAALIALIALLTPRGAVMAIAAVLLANLGLGAAGIGETWIVLAVLAAAAGIGAVAARFVDAPVALVVTVAAYLVALGASAPLVALSPLGPTQNARFYGLSNLLATFLLAATVVAVPAAARRFGLVAAAVVAIAAFVATAGTRFGADGGGAVVLAVGLAVLAVLLYPRRRYVVAAVVVAGAAALLAVDLLTGGESHVSRALENGVFDDLTRRVELSWERATRTWYEALYLAVLVATLAVLAWRTARRHPALAALAVALGVSLVVNDSPNEILVPGVASYFALSRWVTASPTRAA